MKIAVIGAGISGLAFAQEIQKKASAEVTIFEKSKGFGGRMATRYIPPFTFDHGAQHFTIRGEEFKNFLKPYFSDGTIQEWLGTTMTLSHAKDSFKRMFFEAHYVACPNMNSLAKKIAENLKVVLQTEISPVSQKTDQGWQLFDKNNQDLGVFDWCISSAPIPQTLRLIPMFVQHPDLLNVKMNANFTLMIGFKEKQKLNWNSAKVLQSPIDWISANHSKPARSSESESFVIQSTSEWAEEHFEDDLNSVQDILLKEAQSLCHFKTSPEDIYSLHRWRYATVNKPLHKPYFLDEKNKLAAIGDWCIEGRVEDAWLSGYKLARRLL